MAISLKHTTQAAGTDAGNGEIRKTQWNEEHALTAAANVLLGTTTAGAVGEISCTAAGRAILDDADAAAQRATLGLVIGTNVQAYDAELAAIAGLTSAADRLPYFTGSGTAALATFTTAGRNLVDDADAAAQRTTLGLGTAATLTSAEALNPPGVVIAYAGTTEPTGWLFCYGQAVSRTTYAALFTAIGTTYGTGDGSTTFNLPDIRGRVVAGLDNMGSVSANRLTNQSGGLDGDILGATGGSETHTLTEAQLAPHTHSTPTSDGSANSAGTGTAVARNTDGTSGSAGSGAAHNNVQPTIILNYIIKT